MILWRRNFDAKGNAKTPMTVWEAEEMGAIGVYLRCTLCQHQGQIAITKIDPEVYIPDVGASRRCGQCGGDEIESWTCWPSVHSPRPPSPS